MNPAQPEPAKPGGKRTWQPPSLAEMQALLPQFQFLALLGRGGMGAVYRATQLSLNRSVAIKVLPGELLSDAEADFAARFRKEALTMAQLNHPGIVSVYESGEAGGLLYIVMEFVDGTDVARMIHSEGKLAPEHVTRILTQVCEALHYAHEQGVVHRDLKPANLLMTREGRVKIADFGLAKHNDDALLSLTKTNVAVGTPDFLAPEAWLPGTTLDGRADLYSLGVTLYQMLTGEIPRGLWKMPGAKAGVDARFDTIIDRAMQPERDARYQSTAELRRDLEQLQSGTANLRPSRVAHPKRRRRIIGALTTVAVGLTAWLVMLWPGEPVQTSPEIRDAARWLAKEKARLRVLSEGQEIEVKTEADLPVGYFELVWLWFDRWPSSPPKPPPLAAEFQRLHAVKTLRIAWLRLPGLPETAYAFLTNNPNLTRVSIEGNEEVTDGVFRYLAPLGQLEFLSITHARSLTGATLTNSAWLPTLRYCDLGNSKFNDEGVRALAGCSQLGQLRFDRTQVSGEGLRALQAMHTLTHLSAGDCPAITAADFATLLPGFPALQDLELRHANFDDAGAAAVATLTNLTHLRLFNSQLTDAGLAKLTNLSRLKFLDVGDTDVTLEGIRAFTNSLPRCEVEK